MADETPLKEQTSEESFEVTLSNFRLQWHKELGSPSRNGDSKQDSTEALSVSKTLNSESNLNSDLVESEEEKAKKLFLKGAEYERNGELYEAIKFYKRAVQLIPDIELRIYEGAKLKGKGREESPIQISGEQSSEEKEETLDDSSETEDHLAKIEKIVSKTGIFCNCAVEQKDTHFSCLPSELITYILKWVVSSELDMISLERFSAVCRGFYVFARDPEIWRLACIKTWGINFGSLNSLGYNSWRQMYIERARLRFNGCYISKTTYMRPGENSFQDQFYRPWHLIKYFRYLRFFPEGVVLMMTTPEEPLMCLDRLKQRFSRAQGVLSGHYRLNGDKVGIVVAKPANGQNKQAQSSNTRFRPRRKENNQETIENTFHLDLQLKSHHPHMYCSLVWRSYTIFARNTNNGAVTSTGFEIIKNKFPSFKFCQVNRFHANSDSPLQ